MLGDLQKIGPLGVVLHSWESISRGAGEDLLCNGRRGAAVADCCFPAERRFVGAGTTSQLARLHVVSLRPGKELPIFVAPPRSMKIAPEGSVLVAA
jgi:hypothetical protein